MNYPAFVTGKLKPGEVILQALTPDRCDLIHGEILLSSESGELTGAIKALIIYGRPIDYANVVEEMGDIEFALQVIRNALKIDRDYVIACNVEKLNTRYPNGYSDQAAKERADKLA